MKNYHKVTFTPNMEDNNLIDTATMHVVIKAYNDAVTAVKELSRYAGRRAPTYTDMLTFRHAPLDKILRTLTNARKNMSKVTKLFQKEDTEKVLNALKDYELYYQETIFFLNGLNINYNLDMMFAFDKFINEWKTLIKKFPQIKKIYREHYSKITGFIEKTLAKIDPELVKNLNGDISTADAIEIVQQMQDAKEALYIPEFYIEFKRFKSIKEKLEDGLAIKIKNAVQHRREKRIDSSFAQHQEIYSQIYEQAETIKQLQEQVAVLQKENTELKQEINNGGILKKLFNSYSR
ncbi:MAG: hypothetical protein MJ158_02490 [Alphaproteobacteria bacterium]|nr:hypothetical protein [Alphaproteobacteria bacterium]